MTYTISNQCFWISWNTLLSLNRWQRQKPLDARVPIYQKMFRAVRVQPVRVAASASRKIDLMVIRLGKTSWLG